MKFPSKVVDYDFNIVPPGQSTGALELPPSDLMRAEMPYQTFGEAFPNLMVPRSEWKARIDRTKQFFRETVTQIYSQGNEGSCVGFGATQSLETTLRRRYGLKYWVSLSGMSVYKLIGNSSNSGAYIPDGISTLLKTGALPVDSDANKAIYQHTHPRTGFRTSLPQGWQNTAKLFKATSSVLAKGMDEIASALLAGYSGIVGRSGHCIPYVYLDYDQNNFFCTYANSWTPQWGDEGFGFDSERTADNLTLYIVQDVVTRPDLQLPEN